ncbi:hypothetical protein K3X44_09955 [Aliiroseovarius crassostreae]|uniref:VpaChn25_0724 family phage protein n=1 Tax=Aliiroseovarius crassostreae TaxID=154981 RepID=UPI00220CA044|nr:hypothetical protein [Aliiroseovarius crassostreae]UWQ00838.1 hypothetical protein K3X44_09955 [Aliiroseovarius crassostreae]
MSSYASTLSKHRRLTILRFLTDSPEYTSNASILVEICNDFGVTSTRDQVTGEIAWLSEQGFVTREEAGDFMVVSATARGVEIAQGKARHDGVKRPRPGV